MASSLLPSLQAPPVKLRATEDARLGVQRWGTGIQRSRRTGREEQDSITGQTDARSTCRELESILVSHDIIHSCIHLLLKYFLSIFSVPNEPREVGSEIKGQVET
jgi:hypothetical protein